MPQPRNRGRICRRGARAAASASVPCRNSRECRLQKNHDAPCFIERLRERAFWYSDPFIKNSRISNSNQGINDSPVRNLDFFLASSSSMALRMAVTLFLLASSRLMSITLNRLYRFSILRLTSESAVGGDGESTFAMTIHFLVVFCVHRVVEHIWHVNKV